MLGRVIPYLAGKKVYGLLTDYIVVSQSPSNGDETNLGDLRRDFCGLHALGCLAQTGRTLHRCCCVIGWDQAPRNRWCDWWNCAQYIVPCEALVDPFRGLQCSLRCWVWRIHYGRCV